MELYSRVGVVLAVLWLLAILACAVVSGVALLAFVAGSAWLVRWYWYKVVARPRVQAVGAWQSYNGLMYRMDMEVA